MEVSYVSYDLVVQSIAGVVFVGIWVFILDVIRIGHRKNDREF